MKSKYEWMEANCMGAKQACCVLLWASLNLAMRSSFLSLSSTSKSNLVAGTFNTENFE